MKCTILLDNSKVSYKRKELLTLREHLCSPTVYGSLPFVSTCVHPRFMVANHSLAPVFTHGLWQLILREHLCSPTLYGSLPFVSTCVHPRFMVDYPSRIPVFTHGLWQLTLREYLCLPTVYGSLPFVVSTCVHPRFMVGSVFLIYSIFCIEFCFFSPCVLCAQCCKIFFSVFSNVYSLNPLTCICSSLSLCTYMILMVKRVINTVGFTLSSLYIMYVKNEIKIHTY